MILVVYGTTGELIKLAPVLTRLRQGGYAWMSASTGQQVEQIPVFLRSLGLDQPDLWLGRGARGHDLRRNADVPGWLVSVLATFARRAPELRRQLRRGPGRPLVLVHGDTMTTALGGLMGRALGMPVAHIESGLRSFDLRHPFPEELNRRLTSAIATILYAPGCWAASNLRRGTIVDTGSNTIRDSLAMCPESIDLGIEPPAGRFGVVSLHRFELLRDRRLLEATLGVLAEYSRTCPLLFIDHSVTRAAIDAAGLGRCFESPGFIRIPRLTFFQFIALARRSAFLVTDSGGNQEEAFYLDLPCLVHRMRTERREGLGENVVLSGYDLDVLRGFLQDPSPHRRRQELPGASASDIIVADLAARGFAAR
jgi:UDP-N-acetylglucosamine 2-epimerase (non-hydrolysing)